MVTFSNLNGCFAESPRTELNKYTSYNMNKKELTQDKKGNNDMKKIW